MMVQIMHSNIKFIGELPRSDYPWTLGIYDGRVFAVNAMHLPFVMTNGELKQMTREEFNDLIK